jgi:hypothetical protein
MQQKMENMRMAIYILSKTDLAQCTTSVPTICCDKMAVCDISLHKCLVTEFLMKENNLPRRSQTALSYKWRYLYGINTVRR